MAGETIVTIVGNLTADPELRTFQNGSMVANFTVAATPRTFNRQTSQWDDGQALFLRCSCWRDMANHVAQSLKKGVRVIVQGRLTQRSYQAQDGSNRTVMDLQVDEVGPLAEVCGGRGRQAGAGQRLPRRPARPGRGARVFGRRLVRECGRTAGG